MSGRGIPREQFWGEVRVMNGDGCQECAEEDGLEKAVRRMLRKKV